MSKMDDSAGASGPPEGGAAHDYDEGSIRVLEGLEAVRLRPGMYVGSTGSRGRFQTVCELIDNTLDEHLAGLATRLEVTRSAEGEWTIADDGRGLPRPEDPRSWEAMFETLYAGSRRESHDGVYHGHLTGHGGGLALVCALTESLTVEVASAGVAWRRRYARGKPVGELVRVGPTSDRGTGYRFRLDRELFDDEAFPMADFRELLDRAAALNPGLSVGLDGEDRSCPGGLATWAAHRAPGPVTQRRTLWTKLDGIDLQYAWLAYENPLARWHEDPNQTHVFINQCPIEKGFPVDALRPVLGGHEARGVVAAVAMLLPVERFRSGGTRRLDTPESGAVVTQMIEALARIPEALGGLLDGSAAGLAVLRDWAYQSGERAVSDVLVDARPLPAA